MAHVRRVMENGKINVSAFVSLTLAKTSLQDYIGT